MGVSRTVSDNEFKIGNQVLVSETDLHGTITYANDAFVNVSGYRRDELMGQPHNILRHPDMPAVAFADLWRSLKLGLPWAGLVKNRRKNGDYYWVMARATPIYENGKVIRYLSVRYAPPKELVDWAIQNYPLLDKGKFKLKGGKVETFWSKYSLLKLQSTTILSAFVAISGALVLGDWLEILAINVIDMFVIGAAFSALVSWRLQKETSRLSHYNDALFKLSQGQFNVGAEFDHVASLSRLNSFDKLGAMIGIAQSNLARNQDEVKTLALNGQQLEKAINVAGVGILVVNGDYRVDFINEPLLCLLKRHHHTFNKYFPDLMIQEMVGSSIEAIFQHSSISQHFDDLLTKSITSNLKLDSVVIELKSYPLVDSDQSLGFVVEWLDKSDEQRFRKELAIFVDNLKHGIFNGKIDVSLVDDDQLKLVSQELNSVSIHLNEVFVKIGHAIGEIAFSRFSTGLPGHYEGVYRNFQNAINLSMRSLNELVGQVQFNSLEVNNAVQELSSGVNNFSDMTQQQAAALQQTSSTMQQMAESVRENSQHIEKVSELSQGVIKLVRHGSEIMGQAIDAMKAIQSSGERIGDITTVIDSLAFQTNLLALNAAVEAARAGEHGRGFAVVAGEVRTLASKSAEAASDIRNLIQASVNEINQGTILVTQSGDELVEIENSVDSMASLVTQVAWASKEQESGIQEVNRAIAMMDETAQQGAAFVEETASSSMHVADQVNQLDTLLASFELSEEGMRVQKFGRTPLAEFKMAHFNWRIRMGNVLSGVEVIKDVSVVKDHHLCGLGKWRDTEGNKLNQFPEMQELDKVHESFHLTVARAIELKNQGNDRDALLLMVDIESLSSKVVELLTQLEGRITRGEVALTPKNQNGSSNQRQKSNPNSHVIKANKNKSEEWSDF